MPPLITGRRGAFMYMIVAAVSLTACSWDSMLKSSAMGRTGSYTLVVTGKESVTATPGISEYPTGWSPDGTHIAFTGFLGRLGMEDVYLGVLTLRDGQAARSEKLLDSTAKEYGGYWSPDGKKIAFFSNRSGNYDIWVMNADGAGLVQLTTDAADDLYPTWSPDGKKMAFLSSRSGEVAVWTMNSDSSAQEQVTAGGNGDWGTDWSPDGKKILFGSIRMSSLNEGKLTKDEALAESELLKSFFETVLLAGIPSENIWTVDLDTRQLTQLTTSATARQARLEQRLERLVSPPKTPVSIESVRHWHPVWSPDGAKIAYVSDVAGTPDLWIMNADGTNPVQLTNDPGDESFPEWSPDGTHIVYASSQDYSSNADIWILTLNKAPQR
jgi:TolB protein